MPASSTNFARTLRRNSTPAERKLWSALRARQLHGQRFRRQYSIDRYVADFCCLELRLVVEVDGGQHDELRHRDEAQRTAHLERRGYTVLRFWNNQVLDNLRGVLERVEEVVEVKLTALRER